MQATGTLYVAQAHDVPVAWFEDAATGLSDAERQRLPKVTRIAAWRRHVLSRYLMRFAVLDKLGAADILIEYPDNGGPIISLEGPVDVGVSLSHCCETTAVFLGECPNVGCDILTLTRKIRWEEIAAAFFSKDERARMEAAPSETAKEIFGHLWCAKEALAKCSGRPLLDCLHQDIRQSLQSQDYWLTGGNVADCAFAVASNKSLAINIVELSIEDIQSW